MNAPCHHWYPEPQPAFLRFLSIRCPIKPCETQQARNVSAHKLMSRLWTFGGYGTATSRLTPRFSSHEMKPFMPVSSARVRDPKCRDTDREQYRLSQHPISLMLWRCDVSLVVDLSRSFSQKSCWRRGCRLSSFATPKKLKVPLSW